jgi:saxitoxin biosynthesis operon SxtJ-like protein
MIEPPGKHQDIEMGSERSFGRVFAIAFTVIGLWPVIRGGAPHLWALLIAAAFLALAYLLPAVLRPLNVIWFRLGLLLGAVVTPVVMGLLYVTTFVPTSLILRLAGRDLLGLEREPGRASYWVARDPPGGGQSTMKRQF